MGQSLRDGLAPPTSAWWRLRVGELDAVGEGALLDARACPGGLWEKTVFSGRQPTPRSTGTCPRVVAGFASRSIQHGPRGAYPYRAAPVRGYVPGGLHRAERRAGQGVRVGVKAFLVNEKGIVGVRARLRRVFELYRQYGSACRM